MTGEERTLPAAHTTAALLEIQGEVSTRDVREAVRTVAANHPWLRTRYIRDGPSWRREVIDPDRVGVNTLDLSTLADHQLTGRVDALLNRAAEMPIHSLAPQLFRATALRLAANRHLLIVVAHELVLSAATDRELAAAVLEALARQPTTRIPSPRPSGPLCPDDDARWPRPPGVELTHPLRRVSVAAGTRDWALAAAALAAAAHTMIGEPTVVIVRPTDRRPNPRAVGPFTLRHAYRVPAMVDVPTAADELRQAEPAGEAVSGLCVVDPVEQYELNRHGLTVRVRALQPTRAREPLRLVTGDTAMTLFYDGDLVPDPDARRIARTIAATVADGSAVRAAPAGRRTADTAIGRFLDHAAQHPDATALVAADASLTYGQLRERAARIAAGLRVLGARPEVPVGLCLSRSSSLVAATLGVALTGAPYVPMEPTHPRERLRRLAEDAGCAIVIGDARTTPSLPVACARVLHEIEGLAPHQPAAETTPVAPANAAYVIYTSGSTGRPKGVVVAQESLVGLLDGTDARSLTGDGGVWTMVHSHAFDFSVWEMWGPLTTGGRLVLVPHTTSRAVPELLELLRSERVTVLSQTPTAFLALQAEAQRQGFPDLAVRTVVFGGEALYPVRLRPWLAAYPAQRLVNMYGITETTVHVTAALVDARDDDGSPIGEALPHLRLVVVDGRLRPVAPADDGEIVVGGVGVARGYLGQPGQTAERFRPDPFGPSGSRLYCSGDLARRGLDGSLRYLGRADRQVKVRGHRIELGEVEAVLSAAPEVLGCAVDLRTGLAGQPALVGYVVTASDRSVDPDRLRSWCASRLPPHCVPAYFVGIAEVPRNANGKLDGSRLPEPVGDVRPGRAAAVDESTTARVLADVWSAVLGIPVTDPDADFFALGGDSILALRVVAGLRRHGITLPFEELFRCSRLGELAAKLQGGDSAADLDQPPTKQSGLALSSMQLSMVYHTELSGDPSAYHDLVGVRLRCAWNEEGLRDALAELAGRHPALRTSFDLSGPEPRQRAQSDVRIPLWTDDLRSRDESKQRAAIAAWREEELRRPFSWERPPLVRAHAAWCGVRDVHLTLSVHHAIVDGWSLAQVLTDLLRLYARRLGDPVPPRPAPPDILAHFLRQESATLTDPETVAYWDRVLTRLPPATMGDEVRELTRTETYLDPALVRAAQRVAREESVPLRSVMYAVHVQALTEHTGSGSPTSGLVVSGRPEVPRADEAAGLFLNMVPVPLTPAAPRQAAHEAWKRELELLPYRRYPFAEMRRRWGRPPFDALFNYSHFHVYEELAELSQLQVLEWWYHDRTTFPLTVEVVVDRLPDAVTLLVTRDAHRIRDGLPDVFLRSLRAMVAD